MAQSRPAWGASPHACGKGGCQGRIDRSGLLPSCEDEADDWETNPDYTNNANERGFWLGDGHGACSKISNASIISALSESIRGCKLHPHGTGKPGARPTRSHKEEGHWHPLATEDSSLWSSRETNQWSDTGAPLLRPYPRLYLHSSAGTGIERASVFECNAAETLNAFFYEKLKACEEAPAQPSPSGIASGAYENEELLTDEPGPEDESRTRVVPRRARQMVRPKEQAKQGSVDPQGWCNRHRRSHTRQTDRRDCTHLQQPTSSGDNPNRSACERNLRTIQQGDRTAAVWGWEEPDLEAGGLPRVLPRCAIAHLQSCMACQHLNQCPQAQPGEEVPYENSWAAREEESTIGRRARSAAPSQRQLQQRLSQVQKWLEQSTAEEPSLWPEPDTHRALSPVSPGCLYTRDAYGPLDQTEGGTCRQLEGNGDPRSRQHPTEPRVSQGSQRGKSKGGNPARHQPGARSHGPAEQNTVSIPQGICSCLFCEHPRCSTSSMPDQQRGAHASKSQPGTCSTVGAAAAQLPAKSRVQRIVEAFERRSRRDAKRVAQERLLHTARQKELDRRARAAAAKEQRRARSHSGSRPPRFHSGQQWREVPKPETRTEEKPQGSRRKADTTKKKRGNSTAFMRPS